jgi:hypothetical protein
MIDTLPDRTNGVVIVIGSLLSIDLVQLADSRNAHAQMKWILCVIRISYRYRWLVDRGVDVVDCTAASNSLRVASRATAMPVAAPHAETSLGDFSRRELW